MIYSVEYKLSGQWFFRKLKNVKGDGILSEGHCRWFILMDETRIEIPCTAIFKFCSKRFESIRAGMEKEAGLKLPI